MSGFATRATYSKCPHEPKCDWKDRGECIAKEAKDRKRTRHVFDSGEIPHLWYHKTQSSARAISTAFKNIERKEN